MKGAIRFNLGEFTRLLRIVPFLLLALLFGSLPVARAATVPLAPGFQQAILKIVVDNDYAVFMGDSSNVSRLFYQNNVAWMTQITNAASLDITPLPGESYIYIAVMGGGGTEDWGGYLNGVDVVDIPGAQVASNRSPLGTGVLSSPYIRLESFISGYDLTATANGTQDITVAQMQTALTGISWSSAVATGSGSGNVPLYKTSGVCCGGGNGLSGKGWLFPDSSVVMFRYPLSSLGLPVRAGNGQVTVDWNAPASGDAPTGYNLQYKKTSDPDSSFTTFSTPSAPTTIDTVTGLTNGVSYTFRVAGTNSYGTGAFSETRTATPTGPPPAPSNLVSTPLSSSAQISFTDPISNGGSAITNYEYSLNGGSTWIAFSPVDTSSPATVAGLTDGQSYSILLRAVNALGSGTQSLAVSVIPGLITRISNFNATLPTKGVRANITISVNIVGKATFSIYGKKIPGCIKVATQGSNPNITATCAWKPATSKPGAVVVSVLPTDGSYAAGTYTSGMLQIGRRSGTR